MSNTEKLPRGARRWVYAVLVVAGVVAIAVFGWSAEDLEEWAALVLLAASAAGNLMARLKTPPLDDE